MVPSSSLSLGPIDGLASLTRPRAVTRRARCSGLPPAPAPLDILERDSSLPRIAMISTHGYVAAVPPLGAADTGGQVVYVLELSRKLALLGYQVDIWTRRFEAQPEFERVCDRVRIIRM